MMSILHMPDRVLWETPLSEVIGKSADRLKRARNLVTAGDLLDFVPTRYVDPKRSGRLSDFQLGDYVMLSATVDSVERKQLNPRQGGAKRRGMAVVRIVDDAGTQATVTFFSIEPHYSVLRRGTRAVFTGTLSQWNNRPQLTHPTYMLIGGADLSVYAEGLVPMYRQVEKVSQVQITKSVTTVLDQIDVPDAVPTDILQRRDLLTLKNAYRGLHLPQTLEDVAQARRRLRYQEAFVAQLMLQRRRLALRQVKTTPRTPRAHGLAEAFEASLPFELTDGQRQVGADITRDLAQTYPMNRLLQGEVGSGKTLVALQAMLTVVDSGAQAALLAPTEVLAAQHATSIKDMLGPLAHGGMLQAPSGATKVTLLTGSMSASERSQAMLDIVSGQAGIVIGTHALIQDAVEFAELGLVVVDEQHRFGVEQRAALATKAKTPPHLLAMTATPIPRSVAMTVFGDWDVSTLRELPKGRQKIVTHVVRAQRPGWMPRVWERVAEECRAGRQVYVVASRITKASDGKDAGGAIRDSVADGGEVAKDSSNGAASGRARLLELPPPTSAPAEDGDPRVREQGDHLDQGTRGSHLASGDIRADQSQSAAAAGQSTTTQQTLLDVESGSDFTKQGAVGEQSALYPPIGVEELLGQLRALETLQGLQIDAMHGALNADEKERVMSAFNAGKTQVLVATTVIEVGVNVPNASMMVIMDADRFGLSQLHQLRGRVGRGSTGGLCLLVTQSADAAAIERLERLAATNDGFVIADLDLELRGVGDVLGAAQSGKRSSFRWLRITNAADRGIVDEARSDAAELLEDDPELTEHPALLEAARQLVDEQSEEFLERG